MSLYVFGVQKLQIANSQRNIDASIKTLAETKDLDKIVTVNNQLEALPDLHEAKNVVSRLFGFIKVLTPDTINLNEVTVDFDNNSFEILGSGEDFKAINTYVDSLKNASFIYADNKNATLAFSSVVLDTIVKDDVESRFKVKFVYEPTIFDNHTEGLKLTVPKITSTQSSTERPKSIFQETPLDEGGE